MPQHMADLYAKQFDVWEQVSRRSSLSALALAATTPRYDLIDYQLIVMVMMAPQ